ncbi:MAG: polysaccharide biosynthesis protein [Proteobacteria bacterium]|nr:polysaccharide biosynthesis protein [Pseudomonadota bacterium]
MSAKTLHTASLNQFGFIQDLFFLVMSFQISLLLRLGDDFSQISTYAVLFNTLLYVLFGSAVFLTKPLYKDLWMVSFIGEKASIPLSVTYITLLYLPVTFVLPPDLSLPRSVPLISWFIAIVFLQIPRILYERCLGKKEIRQKNVSKSERKKAIDINCLLDKKAIPFDRKPIQNLLTGKRILITGAGGTIGRELARQIADLSPAHLCLIDHSEYLLYMAELELKEHHLKFPYEYVLGDVSCRERIRHIIASFKPDFVFHAAALKHIFFAEENPSQAVLTNVIGTQNVADACRDFNVSAMILASTNEVMSPINVMGATKRLAECYCQALDILERKKPNGTRFGIVRFGNVLGSSGSVVPLFQRQIEKGGPLTITHPDSMRYFISIAETAELILQSVVLILKAGGSSGRVFVLDMGDPIKIIDLAKKMVMHAGLQPDIDIEFKFTGLRPGEKLLEDPLPDNLLSSEIPSILTTVPRTMDHGFLGRALHELEGVVKDQDKRSILRLLHALVPEFKKHEIDEDVSSNEIKNKRN